ncbi:MAG: hypothetical protein ABOJ95_000479 [Wolbachia endosymbiont of Armadillidium vulgare]|nr:hypothetical protein [Wolbachia endosymbiont of Armadillidium vulgare]
MECINNTNDESTDKFASETEGGISWTKIATDREGDKNHQSNIERVDKLL